MATKTAKRVTWSNWAGNQTCSPDSIEKPSSEEEIARIVREAAEAGGRVKVTGTGHSFTAIALTDGRMISLDN